MDMAITNNTLNGNSDSATPGIAFLGGASFVSFEDTSCLALSGNNVSGSPGGVTCGGAPCVDFYVEEVGGTTLFEEVPNTGATTVTVPYIQSTNDPDLTESVNLFGVIDLTNGALCTRP
jgi:hypothetical protein